MRLVRLHLTLSLLAAASIAAAQQDAPVRSISVSGTVETKVAPDLVVWSITLTDTDPNMQTAKANNDAKIEAVIKLKDALDVADGDIETGSVSIRREFETDLNGRRTSTFSHFKVNRSVKIRQRDLTRFDEFLDALVSSAEMDVYFSFESSKMHEVRATTRLEALKIAQSKARDMGEAVGAKLGDVLSINEEQAARPNPFSNAALSSNAFVAQNASSGLAPSTDAASDRFIPGAMTVKMTVYATFELI